jgi:hypothetical protein
MNSLRSSRGMVGLLVLVALPSFGLADTYLLRRDNVIPVVFKESLTIKDNRPGDTFTVKVVDTDQLPKGTELLGRIDRIHPARGNRPASMDLRFIQILLPDRSKVVLDAAPLPLDNKYITRTGDGRIVAKQDIRQQQNDILGGAIGGFIVGSIFHRRIAGTIIGTMIGVAAAESSHDKDSNVIVTAGDKCGALINQDVRIDFEDVPPPPPGRDQLDQGMANPATIQGPVDLSIRLNFRRHDLEFPRGSRPFYIGKNLMVPLGPMAKHLGLKVDRHGDRTIDVSSRDSHIHLSLNSRQAKLDDKRIDLPRTVMELKGSVFVPLDALTPLVKDGVLLNGSKYVPPLGD